MPAVLLLFNELSELYSSSCLGGSSATPSPTPSQPYASFATWQRSQERSGAWAPALEFWRARLASMPRYLGLPYTSNALEPVRAGPGGYVPMFVPEEVLTQLNKLAVQHSTTLYCVLVAALGVLLMRYNGEVCNSKGSVFLWHPFLPLWTASQPLPFQLAAAHASCLVAHASADQPRNPLLPIHTNPKLSHGPCLLTSHTPWPLAKSQQQCGFL